MTKRIIDADALLEKFTGEYEFLIEGKYNKNIKINDANCIKIVFLTDLIDAINELATPANVKNEQIDIYNTKIQGSTICSILATKIKNLEEACRLRSFGRDLPIIHAKTSLEGFVNYIFSGNYKKYEEVEFVEPQKNIFEASYDDFDDCAW